MLDLSLHPFPPYVTPHSPHISEFDSICLNFSPNPFPPHVTPPFVPEYHRHFSLSAACSLCTPGCPPPSQPPMPPRRLNQSLSLASPLLPPCSHETQFSYASQDAPSQLRIPLAPPPHLPPPPHPPHFTTRAQVNPSLSECGSQVAAAHVDSSTGMQHALGRRSTAAANRRDR